ncbi:sigma-70 family RNA polymerase sigma factor [Paenibacillus sp. FSL R7-0273]|uniref:sigma-70 family RNA polymerase sigma factor n=1 Tax=Paenibacillus sp. FSL R7-0273 TaxID=1536772 RepID=UPI0007C63CF2|nr:sigma-70 family RNA polymerase sigma factor [Paenibacillus sp. FSL R7-0273]OMF97474.1 hypothetical protein BK144_02180 [Paenibacillus sp. FSL R7-0273]
MAENIRDVAVTEEDEQEQFYRLVSREKHKLYGLAFSYVRNEAGALEVLQETACRAWMKRESLKDNGNFPSWLMRILMDCCNDELKRGKAGLQPDYSEDRMTVMKSGGRLDLEQALDSVTDNCRQVLVLTYYQELSFSEIAEVLDKPEGDVKAWLDNGLKQLGDKMRRKAEPYPDVTEAEDRLLRDYFQEIAGLTADVPELKLDTAIHNGIAEGRHRSPVRRRRYNRVIIAVFAVVLFASLAWSYGQLIREPEALPPQSWGELEEYREAIGDNLTVTSALDAGYVQHVNIVSPEVGGFQFTIDGVIADRRGVILLYRLENSTDKQYINMKFNFKADEHSTASLTAEGTYFYSGYHNYRPGMYSGIVRDVMIIPWNNLQTTLPDHVFATLTLLPMDDEQYIFQDANGEVIMHKLGAVIDLDETAEYSAGDEVVLEEGFNIAGYTYNINDLYLGPTGIYMTPGYQGKDLDVYGEYGFGVVMGTGKHEKELSKAGDFSSDSKIYYIFHNDSIRPKDPVRMDIEGLHAIDKARLNLVINSDTREIIQAPDERLTLSDQMDYAEPGEMILDMTMQVPEEDEYADIRGFSLDSTFMDGEGVWHWLVNPEDQNATLDWDQRTEGTKAITTVRFRLGTEKLPQPLTFKLSAYPGMIIGDDRIRIR